MTRSRFRPPTPGSRRSTARRLDRRSLGVTAALAAMRGGASLHLHHSLRSGPVWWLSDGKKLGPAIAEVVVANPGIVAGNDALFAGVASQTYRWGPRHG